LGQEGNSLVGVVASAKDDEAAELICRFTFLPCSSGRNTDCGALARSGTGTLEIYFLSGFGTAILVNIRLNSARRSLSSAWASASAPNQSMQWRNH
jgi:hypothetical protein